MLPKKHRLNRSSDVKKTTLKGRSFFNPHFTIKVFPNQENARLTVIASTKVSKKAVTRNRLKRIVRQFVQKNYPEIKNGDYAIILKSSSSKIPAPELYKSLENTFAKSRILKQ